MTKPRGRQQWERGLVDMGTRPVERHWTPDLRGSKPAEYVFPLLGDQDRVIERTLRDARGQIVDFALVHEALVDSGDENSWSPVAKVDCDHGEVHIHRYDSRGKQKSRRVFRVITGPDDVGAGYDHAVTIIFDKWEENRRRWEYGY